MKNQNSQIEIIKIDCPLCNKVHEYRILFKRVLSLGLSEKTNKQKKFTWLFTCPISSKDFQATVYLPDSFLALLDINYSDPNKDDHDG